MTSPPLMALLAAGRSSRFGADKLGALCAGAPLASHAARAVLAVLAAGLPAICVTTQGPRPAWLPGAIPALPNPLAATGLASSVVLAAREAQARGASALIIHLADMPCVPAALLAALTRETGLAACLYPSGRPGVPARFPAARLDALAGLTGDRGAAALLAGEADLTLLECTADDLVDVDTPEALARAEAILRRRAATNPA